MSTYVQPVMEQRPHGQTVAQQALYDRLIIPQPLYNPSLTQLYEKPQTTVQESFVERKRLAHNRTSSSKKYYIPTFLRTGFLLAFCIFTFVVFTLLQAVSVAYITAHGFEAPAVDSFNAKREAYPQSSNPSCPPGEDCAPGPTSSTGPEFYDKVSGAPGPGSFTTAIPIYFLGAYAPTLLAILLCIWWTCIFAKLKEMEPYYQLAKTDGAQSGNSLFLSYSSDMLPLVLIKSLRSKHWLTFIGAANMLFVTICTIFAAETLHLIGVGDGCGVVVDAEGDENDDCQMQPMVKPALGFVLGALLLAVLLGTGVLLIRLRRYSSGLVSEATSIAGIASLSSPAIAQASKQSLRNPSRRFGLALSEFDGTNSIVETTSTAQEPLLQPYQPPQTSLPNPKRESHWEMHPTFLALFIVYQAAILILVLYYRYVSKPGTNNPIEDFMNSESFGVHLFMTCLGLGTKFYWGWIEKFVRQASPYVALAASDGATAEMSVLMTSHSHPVTALFSRSTWRHGISGPATLMAVLSEVLVVTLNTVPFTDTTAYTAFLVSVYFCIIILSSMILTVPAVILWVTSMKKKGNVADTPGCIADVLWMIEDVERWRSLSGLNVKERAKTVDGWHVRFATRQVHGRWQIVTV